MCRTLSGMWRKVGWAAGCFAAIIGFSRLAYGVLVPAMRHDLGGNYAIYGLIGAANLAGYLGGTFFATKLARRPDRLRHNALALGAMCLAMAASGLVSAPIVLGVLRFLVGVASGVALALTLALAVEGIPPARRGLAAAIVWGGGSLGVTLVGAAGLAAPFAGPGAWRVQWVVMAIVGAACAVVFSRLTHDASGKTRGAGDDGSPIGLFARHAYLPLTLGYFAYGAGYIDVLTFFGAALARSRALPPAAAWVVLGAAGTVSIIIWGPLLDRFRNGMPVAFASGLCALGTAAVATGNAALTLVGALAIGISFIGVPAMVGALLQQRETTERYPRAFASMTVVLGVAQVLGPVLGGFIADRLGTHAALFAGAVLLAIAAACAGRYRPPARAVEPRATPYVQAVAREAELLVPSASS